MKAREGEISISLKQCVVRRLHALALALVSAHGLSSSRCLGARHCHLLGRWRRRRAQVLHEPISALSAAPKVERDIFARSVQLVHIMPPVAGQPQHVPGFEDRLESTRAAEGWKSAEVGHLDVHHGEVVHRMPHRVRVHSPRLRWREEEHLLPASHLRQKVGYGVEVKGRRATAVARPHLTRVERVTRGHRARVSEPVPPEAAHVLVNRRAVWRLPQRASCAVLS